MNKKGIAYTAIATGIIAHAAIEGHKVRQQPVKPGNYRMSMMFFLACLSSGIVGILGNVIFPANGWLVGVVFLAFGIVHVCMQGLKGKYRQPKVTYKIDPAWVNIPLKDKSKGLEYQERFNRLNRRSE